MCHCLHRLDARSFQHPPHSLFFFLLPSPLVSPWSFLRIVVTYLSFHVYSLFLAALFPVIFFLSRLIFRFFPYRDSSACFWSYLSTKKQSTLHIIEVGMGGKPIGVHVLFTFGLFLQSLIIFHLLNICHFISSGV